MMWGVWPFAAQEFQLLHQRGAVRHFGQRVVQGLMQGLFLVADEVLHQTPADKADTAHDEDQEADSQSCLLARRECRLRPEVSI
jgi:hypothetical protein